MMMSSVGTSVGYNLSSTLQFRRLLVVIKQTAYEEYTQVREEVLFRFPRM